LARERTLELIESCRILAAAPSFLDFPDGSLGVVDEQAVLRSLRVLFQARKPDVVITLGPDGVYGSIDHRSWTSLVGRAHAALAAPRPRLLHCVFPAGLFEPVRRLLRRHRGVKALIAAESGDLGVAAGEAELRVDIRPVTAIKRAAIAAHRSQLVGADPDTFLRPGLIRRLMEEEWFMVAGGAALPPGSTHPFAGL